MLGDEHDRVREPTGGGSTVAGTRRILYVPSCTADACSTYTEGSACSYGCWQNACNTTGPSFDGDATAPPGTLDPEANLDPSSGSEAASTDIVVTVQTTPINSVAILTLNYTVDDFANTLQVACTIGSVTGTDDVWTATIPGQDSGTTVRFYFDATPYTGSDVFFPGGLVNYTYVTP